MFEIFSSETGKPEIREEMCEGCRPLRQAAAELHKAIGKALSRIVHTLMFVAA